MADDAPPSLYQLTSIDPAFRANPHARLDLVRQERPIFWDPVACTYILARYIHVRAIATERDFWRDPIRAEPSPSRTAMLAGADPARRSETTSILMLDDPEHGRIKQPLAKALNERVATLRPVVEQIVDEALDRLFPGAPFDLMSQFCVPIPVDVIASVLGVDRARLQEFRDWSEGVIQGLNPFRTPEQTDHMHRSEQALADYIAEMLAARRSNPGDDLISDMARGQADAQITDIELQINLAALLVGGNLTTADLIGNGAMLLMAHPAQLERLRQDPKLAPAAVEEILRYESPIDVTTRIASKDIEVGGCPMRKSQVISLLIRSANRDPDVFTDPHVFDIERDKHAHVAFGGGSHFCIGASLARLEAEVALTRLFARFPNLRLASPESPLSWRSLPIFRGLESLVVMT